MVEHKEIDFEDLIGNISSNPEKWMKPGDSFPVPIVLIEKFKINVTHESAEIILDDLFKIFEPHLYGKGFNIVFLNNIFISNENKINSIIKIILADSIYVTFINNAFDQVNLSLYGVEKIIKL